MDLSYTADEEAFRARVRAWLAENGPAPGSLKDIDAQRGWQRRLHAAGFLGAAWPKEYGGAGLSEMEPAILNEIHRIKRELLLLRRTAWPEREVINALQREEAHLIRPETRVFLRDCYDHTIQVIDIIETYRDLSSGLLEVYLSSTSNRLNEVMKVLTIISTIFIPLNFIAGVYGMNFHTEASPLNMPELNWLFGYPAALGFMAAVAGLLVVYFRRKGWF